MAKGTVAEEVNLSEVPLTPFHFPELGLTVEAIDLAEATEKAKRITSENASK